MTVTKNKAPVLIIGAKSDIAGALAHLMAADGYPIYLAARDPAALTSGIADLRLRYGVPVDALKINVSDVTAAASILSSLSPLPHTIVSMVGWMGDQLQQQSDPSEVGKVVVSNFTGPAAYLEAGANLFADIEDPTCLVGVSSVAGDRGRAKNYYYGAAKAAFTSMLSGLRQRLSGTNTTVITVKPGFVKTRATADMDLSGPLADTAETCAKMIFRAIQNKQEVVYPLKWRLIMAAIRGVPEPIFKRMKV